jgi:hypothetical protein
MLFSFDVVSFFYSVQDAMISMKHAGLLWWYCIDSPVCVYGFPILVCFVRLFGESQGRCCLPKLVGIPVNSSLYIDRKHRNVHRKSLYNVHRVLSFRYCGAWLNLTNGIYRLDWTNSSLLGKSSMVFWCYSNTSAWLFNVIIYRNRERYVLFILCYTICIRILTDNKKWF